MMLICFFTSYFAPFRRLKTGRAANDPQERRAVQVGKIRRLVALTLISRVWSSVAVRVSAGAICKNTDKKGLKNSDIVMGTPHINLRADF